MSAGREWPAELYEPHIWAGDYEKEHYILTTPIGEGVLCWPNAGYMNASDGSGRMWAPCSNCTVRMIELDETFKLIRSRTAAGRTHGFP